MKKADKNVGFFHWDYRGTNFSHILGISQRYLSLFTHREKQWQISIEHLSNGNKYSSSMHQAVSEMNMFEWQAEVAKRNSKKQKVKNSMLD